MFSIDDFIGANAALGAVAQFSGSREDVVEYAVSEDLLWALPGFIGRQGLLDDDWRRRLRELRIRRPGV